MRFGAGYARWEKAIAGRSVSLSVFVPFGIDARVYYIEGAAGLNLCWALQPVLGGGDPSSLRCGFERGVFRARNGEAYLPKAELLAASSAPSAGTADYAPPAMHMTVFAEDKTVLVCGCCSGGAYASAPARRGGGRAYKNKKALARAALRPELRHGL